MTKLLYSDSTYVTYAGESKRIKDWADIVGLKSTTIRARLNRGASVEEALTKPLARAGTGLCSRFSHERSVWANMKTRCYNKNSNVWKGYGGRGITVCDRWLGADGFANFLADMGPRLSENSYLDRIDNDGNYEPSNCRWTTWKNQQRNRRTTRYLTYDGQTRCLAEWAEMYGIPSGLLWVRLERLNWSLEKALTTAPRKLGSRKRRTEEPTPC